jgi:6-phosphogluconolactonase (cycloisomerase 2 family)
VSTRHRLLAPVVAALPAAAFLAVPGVASAGGNAGAVYVLSNQTSGNAVLAYARQADGSLDALGSFATGGLGTGGGLGSQGAVVLDGPNRHLYAVDAGSDSITSFRVLPDGLARIGTVPSGGSRPTSITVHGGLVYVLNAGGAGSISGFRTADGVLTPLAGSTHGLSGSATAPAQVSFAPDGRQLVVAERATNALDVFPVASDGRPGTPTVVASSGATPFGFGFDNKQHLVVSEAFGGATDASAVSSYALDGGSLDLISGSVPTTETAACWIATTADGRFAYAGNAGSASISGYRLGTGGALSLLTPGGRTGSAAAGVTDLATSGDSRFLYARLGNGTVGGYAIGADGSLTPVGTAAGLPTGAAGIASR